MKPARRFIPLILIITIIGLLFTRLYLSITRYIDPDEFAHLHWAYLLSQGNIAYKDFFINFTPLYHALFVPLFWLPQNPSIVILGRLLHFLLYLLSLFLLYTLSIQTTKHRLMGLLTLVIYLVFPMTFDKSIELRPDLLMTVFLLAALVMIGQKKLWSRHRALMIGVVTGLSILTLVKILYAIPALMIYFFFQVPKNLRINLFFWTGIGIILPIACYLLYLGLNGASTLAFENIVHGSQLIKAGEGSFSPWLSFSPVPLVYVDAAGVSFPWLINTLIWIASIAGLLILTKKNRPTAFVFFLFLAGGVISLFLFPTPYMQYFIPLSPVISILAALCTSFVFGRIKGWFHVTYVFLILTMLLISGFLQYRTRVQKGADNQEQLQVIADIIKITNPDETVYDMVGSYVLRPDGYYICCNIYSQFASGLSLGVPTLAQSLTSKETKFIVLDRAGKSLWLPVPSDLTFIQTHYFPSSYPKIYLLGFRFQCSKGLCYQHDLNNKQISSTPMHEFIIVIPETYHITTNPPNLPVAIDGVGVNQSTLPLTAGTHRFTVPISLTSLTLQLNR